MCPIRPFLWIAATGARVIGQRIRGQAETTIESDVPVVEMGDGEISWVGGFVQTDFQSAEKTEVELLDDDTIEHAICFIGQQVTHAAEGVRIADEKRMQHVVRLRVLHDDFALVVRLPQITTISRKLHVQQ